MPTTENRSIKLHRNEAGKVVYYTNKQDSIVLKRCSKCNRAKPLSQFNLGNDFIGKDYRCRNCKNEADREYRATEHGRIVAFLHHSNADVREAEEKHNIVVPNNLKLYGIAMARATDECIYCERPLQPEQITLDHVQILERRGSNDFRNLLPCCKSCNSRKGTKPLFVFLRDYCTEYVLKKVVFTLSQRYGVTYEDMLARIKIEADVQIESESKGAPPPYGNRKQFDKSSDVRTSQD